MVSLNDYSFSPEQVRDRIESMVNKPIDLTRRQQILRQIIGFVDLTTLEGSDTEGRVRELCNLAIASYDAKNGVPYPAAVCVYPTLVSTAKDALNGFPVLVASVAGAFPGGQSPLDVKVEEVKYALRCGADEIDTVISRGKFLEGKYQEVFDEIAFIREACGDAHLKVILETGELGTLENIYHASRLSIRAGADVIKTSTGKIPVGATPEAFLVMVDAINDEMKETGKTVGIKAAGGVRTPDDALQYYQIVESILGNQWLHADYFRIGASSLLGAILHEIYH